LSIIIIIIIVIMFTFVKNEFLGVQIWQGQEISLCPKTSRLTVGATQPPF
jgi:hypothetical protein